MTIDRLFLPIPRRVENRAGFFTLPSAAFIVLQGDPRTLLPAGRRFQIALEHQFGLRWQISASPCVPAPAQGLLLRIANDVVHPQGYRLEISGQGLSITAADAAGAFYGVCTLIQWLAQQPALQVECLSVEDWPDFPARGVMLDISRDRVPTMQTLYELVDRLAGWKVNQLQLYMEHTFAYQAHPEVWSEASPMTAEEILDLDAYCRERFIELVPNQNSFGHMERWLKHPRYAALAEIQGEFSTPWGKHHGPFSLAPADPGSFELVSGLYDELLPHFTSRMVNVGCDETFDLGQGRSRELCAQSGVGRVYLKYLNRILAEIQRRGRLPQFWGDIIIKHPDLVPELPKGAIALEWGYEASHPFDEHGAQFEAAGVPFYVCPGTSSWNSLAGRTDNALGNLVNAAENGLKHGASGYLNTDWGDNGHWQVPPVSWLGLAAGAAFGWCLKSNADLAVPQTVSRFAFDDPSESMGRLAFELGNVYRAAGFEPPNSSLLYHLIQAEPEQVSQAPFVTEPGLRSALQAIDATMPALAGEHMTRPDAALIRREYENTARLMRYACRRGLGLVAGKDPDRDPALHAELAAFLEEYRALWLERSRPGGLKDSVRRFEQLLSRA
ncbi:N-acetyl-beta-hexosaminidase [Longilinea arvoryzae]|uniref:N-acetyl-beta-hexosaminidase n=1 Tax=Longilinea arvoryzae TaxID=360412 RepID=A0A0S7BLI3_9CHLR|nr:glycoside hydrolase family 20 zincin-like fold domain-containing protein [Longilinea arvoryzae]GAP15350.1 N-acetyl-beta-hexosaminidase [Longilinea arvoryzae]